MRPLTPFVLCADDYGLTPGVSAGIRELLQDERLTATSCIVASPHWPAEGAKLRAMPRSFDVGEFAADVQLRAALETIRVRLSPLVEKLDDTTACVASDAYDAALEAYHYARQNGEGEGLDELIALMSQRFARNKRTTKPDTN